MLAADVFCKPGGTFERPGALSASVRFGATLRLLEQPPVGAETLPLESHLSRFARLPSVLGAYQNLNVSVDGI